MAVSNNQIKGFIQLFLTSLPKVPWKGYIFGLLIPLIFLDIGKWRNMYFPFFCLCLAWCILFFIVDFYIKRWPCIFPLITFFMVLTQYLAAYHAALHPESALLMSLVPGFDNGIMGIIFLGSLFTNSPIVLFLIDKEAIERMPEKIKSTSFFIKAWFKVTLTWGIVFVTQSLFLTYLRVIHSSTERFFDTLFSWPIILILLIFSVMFPMWYWQKNAQKIEQENTLSRSA